MHHVGHLPRIITSVVIRPLAFVQYRNTANPYSSVRVLKHFTFLRSTPPCRFMAVLFVFYSSQTNVKMPRCRFSTRLSYTHRSFSSCLTASTHCLDVPRKWTTGASSTSLKKKTHTHTHTHTYARARMDDAYSRRTIYSSTNCMTCAG